MGNGEAVIEDVFVKNGFTVFHPETLSLYDTISVLKGCKMFAATSATNIHNAIFMDDCNTAICLNRSAHFHPIQTMIERMRDLKSIYIDVFTHSSIHNFGDAPCFLFPTDNLLRFFVAYKFKFNKIALYLKVPNHFLQFWFISLPRFFLIKKLYPIYINVKSKLRLFRNRMVNG